MYYGTSSNLYIQMGCLHGENAQHFKLNDDKFLAWLGCGGRRLASCGSFFDDIFVAQKQAPLSFLMVGEKDATEMVWVAALSFGCDPGPAAAPGAAPSMICAYYLRKVSTRCMYMHLFQVMQGSGVATASINDAVPMPTHDLGL